MKRDEDVLCFLLWIFDSLFMHMLRLRTSALQVIAYTIVTQLSRASPFTLAYSTEQKHVFFSLDKFSLILKSIRSTGSHCHHNIRYRIDNYERGRL